MSLRSGLSECDINEWRGSLQRLDSYSIDIAHSLYTQNMQFLHGQLGTRYGSSVPLDAHGQPLILSGGESGDGPITSFINWLFTFSGTANNTITYYAPAVGVRGWQQSGAGFTAILIPVVGAEGANFAVSGERLYAAFYDDTGKLGFTNGYVYGWDTGADKLFAPPISNSITGTEPGSGSVTAGIHNVGYIFTTHNGYTGALCPGTPGNPVENFTPYQFTASGSKNAQFTISGSLPSYLIGGSNPTPTFQIVMSTVANPNTYYAVPGAIAGCFNPTVINVDISDTILAETGTDVTAYMNLLTQQISGNGPIDPVSLGTYSSRMGYCGIDMSGIPVVYFSEPNNFQYITADQHGIYLDGFQQPVVHYTLNGVDYIATVNSHFSVEDNGDVPVTWIPPQKVDGNIGVQSPTCIAVNPSLGYALVASERGLYIFQGGVFPALPISYYQQPDWNRINWINPTHVQVSDDPLAKKWSVLAPLNDIVAAVSSNAGVVTITTQTQFCLYQSGINVTFSGAIGPYPITVTGPNIFTYTGTAPAVGATIYPQQATHVMTWDYTEGDTPETVKYSLNSNTGYLSGATAQVLNGTTNLTEVWYAPFMAAGAFIRRCDGSEPLPYQDIATNGTTAVAINSWNSTALVPGQQDQTQLQAPATRKNFYGTHMRTKGNGGLNMFVAGLDSVITLTPAASPLALSPTPGEEILVRWFLRSPQQSFSFGTNAIGQYFIMSLARFYYSEAMPQGAN